LRIFSPIVGDGDCPQNKGDRPRSRHRSIDKTIGNADRQSILLGSRSHERELSQDRGVKGSATKGHGKEGQWRVDSSRTKEKEREKGRENARRDVRPGMYPRHNDTVLLLRADLHAYACVRITRAWRRKKRRAPAHGGRETDRSREWRWRQNDVKDARVARGGGVVDRRKKKPRTAKERKRETETGRAREKEQGEANGRSKQVEAVERGRASVSAVHLVHSCSLRRERKRDEAGGAGGRGRTRGE